MKEFINIIEFKMLNPEGIVRLFIPDWSFKDFITGVQQIKNIESVD